MVLFAIFLLSPGRIQGGGAKGETASPQISGGKCPHPDSEKRKSKKGEKKGKKRIEKDERKKEKRG